MAYHPNPWLTLPFALWLLLIAVLPYRCHTFWSRHYAKLSVLFAAITLGCYFLVLRGAATHAVLRTMEDYFSFIVLIGSLYVVSGGIHISVSGAGTPWQNVCFLALGGLAANVLGTTGASMLLIRPWLRLNASRAAAHHLVFFIFIVANIGGGLTPMGDPPLLLGYLKGVPFWWVAAHCGPAWLVSMVLLLGAFYCIDRRGFRPSPQKTADESIFVGRLNLFFLAIIVGSVFISRPPFLREGLMLLAATGSYFTTGGRVHLANEFSFKPMIEVAVLFFGIFATMIPAMDWLQANARLVLGSRLSPSLVFWNSGAISGVLDNAPAYLAFLSALAGAFAHIKKVNESFGVYMLLQTGTAYVAALSIATVFFGAFTYIGNGPNLMVKAIAEKHGLRAPTFVEYIFKWSVPILLPLLLIVWFVFVRVRS